MMPYIPPKTESVCEWPIEGVPSCMRRMPEASAQVVQVKFLRGLTVVFSPMVFCEMHAEMARQGIRA